jgi:Ribonucleotide reductase, all-alpha domain
MNSLLVVALSPNALRMLEARYLLRDGAREVIETPGELFARVARAVAQGELAHGSAREAAEWEAIFHDLLTSLDFLPNSPTLMNAGTPLGQLIACFVLPGGGGHDGVHLRRPSSDGIAPERRRGHRIFFLPPPSPWRHRRLHRRRGIGTGVLHEDLRLRDAEHQAGRPP